MLVTQAAGHTAQCSSDTNPLLHHHTHISYSQLLQLLDNKTNNTKKYKMRLKNVQKHGACVAGGKTTGRVEAEES